jgi:hypothetical protein
MIELPDLYADGVGACCSGKVLDMSGENIEGRCNDCGEMTEVIGVTDE